MHSLVTRLLRQNMLWIVVPIYEQGDPISANQRKESVVLTPASKKSCMFIETSENLPSEDSKHCQGGNKFPKSNVSQRSAE